MDKLFSNIRIFFVYSYKSIIYIYKIKKEYLLFVFLKLIINSVKVFPSMFLLSNSIDLLTRKVDIHKYIISLILIILIMLIISLLGMLVTNRYDYLNKIVNHQLRLKIDNICMHVDYEQILSKTFLENKELAIKTIDNGCLDLFLQSFDGVFSSIIIMGGVFYIISDVSILLLMPFAVTILLNFYNSYLNARQNYIDTKDEIEYGRKSSYIKSLSTDFSYAKEIRLFDLKNKFKKRMDEVDELLFKIKEERRKKRRPSAVLAYTADTVLEIAIYLYLGYQVIVLNLLTLGKFTLYSSALRQMKDTVSELLLIIINFVINTEYLKAFFAFMNQEYDEVIDNKQYNPLTEAKIEFQNVSFKYPNSDVYALKDINITIQSKEKLLIVGENGAGKSTFIKLLCGLYKPTSGTILLNGKDISQIDFEEYLTSISAVFQDYKLFAMSISDNISSLDINLNEIRLQNVLKQVELKDKIYKLENRAATSLYRIFDENGLELSGGEMQRLAIARAFYKNSPILILDEPTSALDPKSENQIYKCLGELAKNRTAIFISHRLSSVKISDKIAVFDKGKIVEYGVHDKLMENNALYSELYEMQSSLYREMNSI